MRIVVGIFIILILGLILYAARVVFVPLIIGAIIAYLLYPVAHSMSTDLRLPHGIATLILYVLLLALLIPVFIALAPVLTQQVNELANELIQVIRQVESMSTTRLVIVPDLIEISTREILVEVTAYLRTLITSMASSAPKLVVGAGKTVLMIIFTFFIAYYLTADGRKFVSWFFYLTPPPYRADAALLLDEINAIWADFFRGQVVLAFVVAAILTAMSWALGLPQPLLLGILGGVLEFLVSIGHTIWIALAIALALFQGSSTLPVSPPVFALIVALAHLIFTKFDLNFLIPKIVGARMHLHPLVVIIGIIIGATLGGVLGIALAAPIIATLRVLGRYIHGKMFDLNGAAAAAATADAIREPLDEPETPRYERPLASGEADGQQAP